MLVAAMGGKPISGRRRLLGQDDGGEASLSRPNLTPSAHPPKLNYVPNVRNGSKADLAHTSVIRSADCRR